MELHRYDIIEAEIEYGTGSIQKKKRPYVIVSNEHGTSNAQIITIMPLTHIIKKEYLPVHECIEAESENGLSTYSMILGEQPQTICKNEVIRKYGTVVDQKQRNMINKVCFNTFFYGEKIDWEEIFA
ncbi:type II toxin-antitoxin system PemK/MazF family toxin [Lacrimispora amygdalina]|uniref:Type II toxin-antitoxin system PemK/MazF family toxin n=1 Tax=Lacrimispora amygdalina TaxID=253257 RepID=A0A3E2NB84_9FIRM|nr:type II toxin-antitoxin system PemK/MazF family toxin [Clostridium indicum]RFZ78279.1 type II toxin-antitoxin system PemK/MazF family toxin [Clostridium indicum]